MSQSSVLAAAADPLDLIRAIAERRDRQAFGVLFAVYAPKLKTFFMRGGMNGAIAEELVQDVMLIVWQRAATFDSNLGGLSTWIFTIARNRRIDHLRREPRPGAEPPTDPSTAPEPVPATETLVEWREWSASLQAALQTLPPEQSEVLQLAYFQHKSHSTIAEEQNLPLGTVKSRVRLALQRLRELLEHER
jgi:RNA polymerase sigma-70 factor (ECF subfamily)